MDYEFGKKLRSIIFRFISSLLIFGVVMTLVEYIYEKFECNGILNVTGITGGVLRFSLATIIIAGSLTIMLYLVTWIFNALVDDEGSEKVK